MLTYLSKFTYVSPTRVFIPKDLSKVGLINQNIYRNLSVGELYEIACQNPASMDPKTLPTSISSTGAMVAYSGKRTGRSPKDKRIVVDTMTEKDVWWGNVNIPISTQSYNILESIAIQYLNTRPRVYIVDGYAGWDPQYRQKIRIYCSRVYHALFMKNMLIKPTKEELQKDFSGDVDFTIYNAGELHAPRNIPGVSSETNVSVNLTEKKMTILGTQYAGEMKKGIFGVMNYFMPKRGVVSLHASATEGSKGDTTLYFGLSGTGKTTLSADPKRQLIGDDEHCWSDVGIFNIEGGCYAKCIDLSPETEPDIYHAIKYGAILENIKFFTNKDREVNYHDTSITENTRCSYPLEHINNAKFPAIGAHPKNIFFLTCDAYGVLPPVSRLTPEQAMYHFISGYTAKVAGTEVGIVEPQTTFSACFGEAFLPLHPTVYAEMLAANIRKYNTRCWLVNTGWSGGKYGVGKRMKLPYTRKIIDAIHEGALENVEFEQTPVFNLSIPKSVPGIPNEILNPQNTWSNKQEFDNTLSTLGKSFKENFSKYASQASEAVIAAGPKV